MVSVDTLADALATLYNNEMRGNREALITPSSKLVASILRVMQRYGYVGEFEHIDDGRWGKLKVQLLGRINRCGSIKPRYSVKYVDLLRMPDWLKSYLPSRDIGIIMLSTSQGLLSHIEAIERKIGGVLIAYVY